MIIISPKSLYALIFCIFLTMQPILSMPPHELSNEPSNAHAFVYLACICIGAALYAIINTYFFQKTDMPPQNKDLPKAESHIIPSAEQNEQFTAQIDALNAQCGEKDAIIAVQKEEKQKLTTACNTLIMATYIMAHQGHVPAIARYWQGRCNTLEIDLKKAACQVEHYKQQAFSPEYKLLLAGKQNRK